MSRKKKAKIGLFKLTGSGGCVATVLLANELFEIMSLAEFISIPDIFENEDKEFDISFVEGSVACEEDKKRLLKIREKSKKIVALGSCAVFGGIPSLKNMDYDFIITKKFDEKVATPLNKHIAVDYYLKGCPIFEDEFIDLLKELLIDKIPKKSTKPVCYECTLSEIDCLLQKGKPCFGPITEGNCDARCPRFNKECTGCRGPLEDMNINAQIKAFNKKYKETKVKTKILKFKNLVEQNE